MNRRNLYVLGLPVLAALLAVDISIMLHSETLDTSILIPW